MSLLNTIKKKARECIETIQKKVDFIKDLNPEIVCGMHCTGFMFNKLMADHPAHTLGVSGTEFRF